MKDNNIYKDKLESFDEVTWFHSPPDGDVSQWTYSFKEKEKRVPSLHFSLLKGPDKKSVSLWEYIRQSLYHTVPSSYCSKIRRRDRLLHRNVKIERLYYLWMCQKAQNVIGWNFQPFSYNPLLWYIYKANQQMVTSWKASKLLLDIYAFNSVIRTWLCNTWYNGSKTFRNKTTIYPNNDYVDETMVRVYKKNLWREILRPKRIKCGLLPPSNLTDRDASLLLRYHNDVSIMLLAMPGQQILSELQFRLSRWDNFDYVERLLLNEIWWTPYNDDL